MKRVLCGAIVAAAAFTAVPAQAQQGPAVEPVVTIRNDENGIGVGTTLPGQPLLGARYDYATGKLCAGFSYQVPQCVVVPPISTTELPPIG